jgi:hypothetical protein
MAKRYSLAAFCTSSSHNHRWRNITVALKAPQGEKLPFLRHGEKPLGRAVRPFEPALRISPWSASVIE